MNKKIGFTCKICKLFLSTPVVVPCGKSVCLKHTNIDKRFDCVCGTTHLIPEFGFPINENLILCMKNFAHLDEKEIEIQNKID